MRILKASALAAVILIGSVYGLGTPVGAASNESTTHAHANATLFATGQQGAELLRIDVVKRTVEVAGPTGVAPQNLALAILPGRRAAYTIAHTQDPALAHLARIDLATGAMTLVGSNPLGQNLYVMGMTASRNVHPGEHHDAGRHNDGHGVLYAAGDFMPMSPTFNSLYTIDLSTGLPTRVGSFGVGSSMRDFIMSLSFDPSGQLYGASQKTIYRIDTTTGTATKVADIKGAALLNGVTRVMGLAFDRRGDLYACDFMPIDASHPMGSTIYTVDLETGQFTPLIRTGVALVHNIAFLAPGPAEMGERG
jgi:hypothetical protein